MTKTVSPLQAARAAYQPKLPKVLAENGPNVVASEGGPTTSVADNEAIQRLFPKSYGLPIVTFQAAKGSATQVISVGVILSGGQAPGGHNVIAGLYDGLKKINVGSNLYGFLGGPSGLMDNQSVKFDDTFIDAYRNTGGFDIIGSGRTKLEKEEQFAKVVENCKGLGITGLVVIGGDDSNTNARMLAEYCSQKRHRDSKSSAARRPSMATSRTNGSRPLLVLIPRVRSIQRTHRQHRARRQQRQEVLALHQAHGPQRLHIALECALQTHPNVAIISEEVEAKKMTLREIVEQIASVSRSALTRRKISESFLCPKASSSSSPK